MDKQASKSDVRASARVHSQTDQLQSMLNEDAGTASQSQHFPRDFTASGTGKGGGGGGGSLEN